jgi:recombination protein RecA
VTKLDDAMAKIDRSFGKGSIMRLGDPGAIVPIAAIPSGSLALDLAMGIGGYPRGRIVEVYGPESSGKTTLMLHALASAQAMGLTCAFIDAEHALDPRYAEAVGVCTDELLLSQPDYGEQALQIADDLVETGEVGVVVIDSVAALTPKAELDGEMGDQTVGLQARMMGQAMRKLAGKAQKTQTLLLFTNQIREKVGVMFGSPETTPGGRALRFYASQRLDVRRTGTVGAKGEQTHNSTKVTLKKNKVAPPFREALFDIDFGRGISSEGEMVDAGVAHGFVAKAGAWFYFDPTLGKDGPRAQGRDAAKALLLEDRTLYHELEAKVRPALGL